MVATYILKQIDTIHLSYFAGVPHGKTTVFILQDTKHSYNFDILDKFRDAHFHIIDISDITPQLINDDESYLMCSGTHYGFHCCVLKVFKSSPVTSMGWPCHFLNYTYYATRNAVGWWHTIDILNNFIIDDVEHSNDDIVAIE